MALSNIHPKPASSGPGLPIYSKFLPPSGPGHLQSGKSFSKFGCPLPTTKQILTFQSDFRFAPFNLKIQQFANPGVQMRITGGAGAAQGTGERESVCVSLPTFGYFGENSSLSDNVLVGRFSCQIDTAADVYYKWADLIIGAGEPLIYMPVEFCVVHAFPDVLVPVYNPFRNSLLSWSYIYSIYNIS